MYGARLPPKYTPTSLCLPRSLQQYPGDQPANLQVIYTSLFPGLNLKVSSLCWETLGVKIHLFRDFAPLHFWWLYVFPKNTKDAQIWAGYFLGYFPDVTFLISHFLHWPRTLFGWTLNKIPARVLFRMYLFIFLPFQILNNYWGTYLMSGWMLKAGVAVLSCIDADLSLKHPKWHSLCAIFTWCIATRRRLLLRLAEPFSSCCTQQST